MIVRCEDDVCLRESIFLQIIGASVQSFPCLGKVFDVSQFPTRRLGLIRTSRALIIWARFLVTKFALRFFELAESFLKFSRDDLSLHSTDCLFVVLMKLRWPCQLSELIASMGKKLPLIVILIYIFVDTKSISRGNLQDLQVIIRQSLNLIVNLL